MAEPAESSETVSTVILGDSMDTKSSEMAFTAIPVASGNTESLEEEAATVSGETGEVCTAQMHKMAVAITGSMENKTSTSETDGAVAVELESVAAGGLECVAGSGLESEAAGGLECTEAGGLECAAAGGLESEAAGGLECVVAGEGLGMPTACAVVSSGKKCHKKMRQHVCRPQRVNEVF